MKKVWNAIQISADLLKYKTGAINDPLGQTHSPSSSYHYSNLKIVLFCEILNTRMDRRTPCVKIVITISRYGGSATWIN